MRPPRSPQPELPSRDAHPARDRPPARNVTAALEISDVQKSFDGRPALDGIDLVVQPGEMRGLPGPNGTAKTTLLSMVFALNLPDSGTISVCGARSARPGPRARPPGS